MRELRAALSRRGLESVLARHSARQALREELKDDLTALLLSCGMALAEPDLSDSIKSRLKTIEELTKHMKEKLAVANEERAAAAGGA